MKLHQYLPALFLRASMEQIMYSRVGPVIEPPKPPEVGLAPDELKTPLLIGRRGKLTRKRRKELRQ